MGIGDWGLGIIFFLDSNMKKAENSFKYKFSFFPIVHNLILKFIFLLKTIIPIKSKKIKLILILDLNLLTYFDHIILCSKNNNKILAIIFLIY